VITTQIRMTCAKDLDMTPDHHTLVPVDSGSANDDLQIDGGGEND
jgi:hypothetical protein